MSSSAEHKLYTSTDARSQVVQSPSLPEISDRNKQRLSVERLEELFLTGEGDTKSIIESNLHAHSPQSKNPSKNYPQTVERQTRSPPDNLRHLRHLGVASPVAGSSAESRHEWVYLNLLINLAQLHTLNVTPELVRLGIQAISTKLVLSEDGSKVRWHGDFERSVMSPDEPDDIATTHHAPTAAPLAQHESKIQLQKSHSLLQDHNIPGSRNEQSLERVDNLQTFAAGQGAAKRLEYKPMFVHHRQRPQESSYESSDGSQHSGSSLSDAKEASTLDLGEDSTNAANGPLVFFDGGAFFLDLSSDPTDADCADHSSYTSHYTEPLGWKNGSHKTSHGYERKQAIPTLGRENDGDWTQCPPLLVNDNNPTSLHDDDRLDSGGHFHFQASGIGGIQLDDNFAIDVKTSRQPTSQPCHQDQPAYQHHDGSIPSSSRSPSPSTGHPCTISTRIVSTTTTQLPPSPLPPPSYVYPALSSTSSETEDGCSSLDDLDSESDYELRKVSLSPQVRMWVQEQSMSPTDPLRGDGWSERSASDGDWHEDTNMEGDEDSD